MWDGASPSIDLYCTPSTKGIHTFGTMVSIHGESSRDSASSLTIARLMFTSRAARLPSSAAVSSHVTQTQVSPRLRTRRGVVIEAAMRRRSIHSSTIVSLSEIVPRRSQCGCLKARRATLAQCGCLKARRPTLSVGLCRFISTSQQSMVSYL